MAVLHFNRNIRIKYLSIRSLYRYVNIEIHPLSRDMGCNDTPPSTITVPWDVSYGTCYDCEYDSFRMRACLGTLGYSLSTFYQPRLPPLSPSFLFFSPLFTSIVL